MLATLTTARPRASFPTAADLQPNVPQTLWILDGDRVKNRVVLIGAAEGDWVEIRCGRARFKMMGLDPRSFPAMPRQGEAPDSREKPRKPAGSLRSPLRPGAAVCACCRWFPGRHCADKHPNGGGRDGPAARPDLLFRVLGKSLPCFAVP